MVSTVAAATHPYLALMIGALMFAAHARDIILNPSAVRRITGRFAAAVGSMALVLWQCGYFVVGAANLKGEKFGLFSMNLLSPVLPLAAYDSAAGPFRPAVRDQYEGYAYLGAGLIMLSLIALFTLRRNLAAMSMTRSDWLRNLPLAIVLVALLLLALGPVISVGPWTLVEYDPKWWGPLTVFRASGRMIWPVYYTFVAGVFAAAIRLGPGRATALLCAAVLLQAWDVSGAYRGLRLMRAATFNSPLHSRFWDVVPQHYRRIVLFPTRMCTAELTFDFRPFALLAGRHGIAINAGTAARADTPKVDGYCRGLERGMSLGTVDADTLYVLRNDLVSSFRARTRTPTICVTIDDHSVCVAQETLVKWQDEFDLMLAILPSLEELVTFYRALDSEYRLRLMRPARPVGASLEERLTLLARYLWYRRGGCTHDEASHKILRADDREVRICGDPFRPHTLPSVAETFAFRMHLEAMYRDRPASASQSSHVDPEGEAVWLQQYVSERLAGRDAFGARTAVLNRIRAVTQR
jgi:hypothetical protein